MTSLDFGVYGAKRQSLRKVNPRDVLARLLSENKGVAESSLAEMFLDTVRNDPDMLESIVDYWFTNNYRSLTIKPDAPAKVTKAKAVKAAVQIIRARAEKMVLLDLTMANGKQLRDCTGKDCSKFSGWMAVLAKRVKPTQKVGEVLSEAQVRSLRATP